MNSDQNPFRQLPAVDTLLKQCDAEVANYGRHAVTATLRDLLAQRRAAIDSGEVEGADPASILEQLRKVLALSDKPSLQPLLNLTGTVLHTNLGRAVLPRSALDEVVRVSEGASNLEFDLSQGERGDRDTHVESLLCELTGAEAATVVNNNAAAVLLVLNTLAMGKEVPVSRGELVEIGGSFRIPDVMARSGATLVEVGATNRTHLKDYQGAISDATALLMKVHCSNYRIEGFTAEVSESTLARLAKEHDLPMVTDLGSGNLIDFAALGLPPEPTVAQAIAAGADVVTFSGDKLLGGPQAGVVAGRKDLIQRIKRNPLKRALRLDKMTLAALAAVLKLYRNPDTLLKELPTLRALVREQSEIQAQAEKLQPLLQAALGSAFTVTTEATHSQIGSGSLPVETLPSASLKVAPVAEQSDVRALLTCLRDLPLPVIGRLHKNALWLDLRCLESTQEQAFIEQLNRIQL